MTATAAAWTYVLLCKNAKTDKVEDFSLGNKHIILFILS